MCVGEHACGGRRLLKQLQVWLLIMDVRSRPTRGSVSLAPLPGIESLCTWRRGEEALSNIWASHPCEPRRRSLRLRRLGSLVPVSQTLTFLRSSIFDLDILEASELIELVVAVAAIVFLRMIFTISHLQCRATSFTTSR